MLLKVKLQPRASKIEIIGLVEDSLKIRVTAPPLENQANQQCIKVLSKFLNIPKSDIILKSGSKSRNKTFDIPLLKEEFFFEKLSSLKK